MQNSEKSCGAKSLSVCVCLCVCVQLTDRSTRTNNVVALDVGGVVVWTMECSISLALSTQNQNVCMDRHPVLPTTRVLPRQRQRQDGSLASQSASSINVFVVIVVVLHFALGID